MSQLIGPDVELHHSTMHIKLPEAGHPPAQTGHSTSTPMGGTWTCWSTWTTPAMKTVRFVSCRAATNRVHWNITQTEEGLHAPPAHGSARLDDTVAVPAKRGDVVCFCKAIHGSHINQTAEERRLVRIGYRAPDNEQMGGQSKGLPGMMVEGIERRLKDRASLAMQDCLRAQ